MASKIRKTACYKKGLPFAGQEALWIPGVRMSDRFRVGPETRKVVEICWDPGRGMNESEELNPADAELF